MKLPHYVILGLLLVIGLMFVFWPSNKPDYSLHEARIAQRDSAFHQLSRKYTKLESKIKSDSVSHKIEVQTYKDRDKKKSAYIANLKANPTIVKVRSEVLEVDTLIQAYDSLLESRDQQLNLQEKYVSTVQLDIGELKNNFEERLKLQSETISDQQSIIQDQRKELRKARRAARATKVAAVVFGALGFVLGSQL